MSHGIGQDTLCYTRLRTGMRATLNSRYVASDSHATNLTAGKKREPGGDGAAGRGLRQGRADQHAQDQGSEYNKFLV